MSERNERTVLNSLIVTCRDAERGFTWAAEHAKDPQLKAMFQGFAKQRAEYALALVTHAERLGGQSDVEGSRWAVLHRAWMAIKDRVVTDHDHLILEEAERGEHAALAIYAEALSGMLPQDAIGVIEAQEVGMRAALKELRTRAAAAK